MALALAIGLQIVPPAIAQEGAQILERALGMDIAVENADPGLGAAFSLPHFHVHGDSLLTKRFGADHRSQVDSPPGFCDATRREFPPAWSGRRRTANAGSPKHTAV